MKNIKKIAFPDSQPVSGAGVAPESGVDPDALWRRTASLRTLEQAWDKVRRNAGAAGGDGVDCVRFERDAATRLLELRRALLAGDYAPGPVRRVEIPKDDGGVRPLEIPCVIDRVAQTAACLTLVPLLEPLFEEASYGYRPGRSVQQAVREVARLRDAGYGWVVEADIERFFERVPHDPLMADVEAAIGVGPLSALIGLWLESGRPAGLGLPQGAPISPLLANLYLDSVDEALMGRGVRLIRFADDFVILCRSEGGAERMLARAADILKERGLALHPEKSRLVRFDDGFRFLGHLFVRSLVLKSDSREADGVDGLLADLAQQDRAEAAAHAADVAAEADQRRRGYDRVLQVLYVTEPGRRLAVRGSAFTVLEPDAAVGSVRGAGRERVALREILAVPHQRVDRIELWPGAQADAETLRRAAAFGAPVSLVDGRGATVAELTAPGTGMARRQASQARCCLDPDARVDLARRLVDGRVRNQRALLRRLNQKRKLASVAKALAEINRVVRALPTSADVLALMGQEGRAAALYWPALSALVRGVTPPGTRVRRPPTDPFNATVSLLSGLLARDVRVLLMRRGLHPGFGALHSPQDGRDAGVYDLMEEFRAPLAEGLAVYLFNNRTLSEEMFTYGEGACRLGRAGVSAAIRGYERWVDRPIRSPRSGRRVSWRRLIEEQAGALARHVEGGEPYQPYVMDY